MEDCIFCAIAEGKIPSRKVYEDDRALAFYDLNPQAPVHVLVIPKRHAADLLEARDFEPELTAHLLKVCADVAEQLGLGETGFRVVSNCGKDACQSVRHLHFHILGGRAMQDRMV